MPRVPTLDNFSVAPSTQPAAAFNAPGVNVGAIGARQAEETGQALMQAGAMAGNIAADEQQRANHQQAQLNQRTADMRQMFDQQRVDQALDEARQQALKLQHDPQAGYTNIRGYDAMHRPDGKPLADEFADTLKQGVSKIGSTLTPRQQQMFGMRANDLLTSFHGEAMRYEGGQSRDWLLSSTEGIVKNAVNEIGVKYSDPRAVDGAIDRIKAEVYKQGTLLGKSGEWIDAQTRVHTSNAHVLALSAALEKGNLDYAAGYRKKYGGQMEANDLLRIDGVITKEMDLRQAVGVASKVVATAAPRLFNTDGDRAFNLVAPDIERAFRPLLQSESGGKQFGRDGQPLTSPKGAIGIAQVMPSTGPEAARAAGLPWDPERFKNDPAYNRAIGKGYFVARLTEFDGNLAQAYASYNAGPGAVHDFMDGTNKTGKNPNRIKTPDGIPPFKETQEYVKKNMAAYEAGGGRSPTPTLMELHAQARAELGPNARPQVVQAAIQGITQQWGDVEKAKKQADEESEANVYRALVQNGGKWGELPPSLRASLPPDKTDNALTFADNISKNRVQTNLALYEKLATDPAFLTGLSDNQFYALHAQLSESDFKHFSHERATKKTGTGANGPGDLNTQAMNQALNDRLRQVGVDPSPKDDGGEKAAQLGSVRRIVRDQVAQAQAQAGKKFTDVETAQFVDRLFASSTEVKRTILGIIPTGTASKPVLALTIGDVPRDLRKVIEADYKAKGVSDPSDAQITEAYQRFKLAPPRVSSAGKVAAGGATGAF